MSTGPDFAGLASFVSFFVGDDPSDDEPLTERDAIPEALPEMDRADDDAPADDADDVVAPDAKPLAGQEPG